MNQTLRDIIGLAAGYLGAMLHETHYAVIEDVQLTWFAWALSQADAGITYRRWQDAWHAWIESMNPPPADAWALRETVQEARAALIAQGMPDVLAECGAAAADSWAGEIECGQQDGNLPREAQQAAEALGVFGRSLPI